MFMLACCHSDGVASEVRTRDPAAARRGRASRDFVMLSSEVSPAVRVVQGLANGMLRIVE